MNVNRMISKKLAVLLLAFALLLHYAVPAAAFANAAPPADVSGELTTGISSYQIVKFHEAADYVNKIQRISVNQTEWRAVSSKMSVWGSGNYYISKDSCEVYFDASALKNGDTIVIQSEGCEDLTLTVSLTDGRFDVTPAASSGSEPEPAPSPTPEDEDKDAPEVTAGKGNVNGYISVLELVITNDYVDNVTEVKVNGEAWDPVSSPIALFGKGKYYGDKDKGSIYFDATGSGALTAGDIISLASTGYKPLQLKVTAAGDTFSVQPYSGPEEQTTRLFVRLAGYFESAVTGQKGYDAVSGASTMVSANKNSNVTVQVAVKDNGETPEEADWKDLNASDIRVDAAKSRVDIDTASGMEGVYSTLDGSVTLSGTPQEPGSYPVSVTLTDIYGRSATSNQLIFTVYSGEELLIDQLKLENAVQTADGKYMYDMEPWAVKVFGGTDETVTVPAAIKAWYGSHTSGTYGELGYAVSGAPVQTLIVPKGCDLTMVNMKILSSVKIIVEDGGKLNLRDSSMHGQIVVEKGGAFSMNYDAYSGEFLNGSSINGQLILSDGAILENSKIYSNTNYLANGSQARQNTEPVVVANGNVTVNGQVFIRGDEAPTGTDASTGKSCSGQPALQVNGTLNLTEGSVLAAYGGGKDALTSVGGDAVILNNGTITGAGRLIAVGGSGTFDDGGNAVSGAGTISAAEAYLEGGHAYMPKDEAIKGGAAASSGITVADTTKKKLVDGQRVKDNTTTQDTYWRDVTGTPDLTLYEIPAEDTPEAPLPTPTPAPVAPTPEPAPNPTPVPVPDPQPLPSDNPLDADEPNNQEDADKPVPSDDPLKETAENASETETEDPDQPKTGDESDPALWLGMMILAGGAAATMQIKKRKEDENA